MVSISNKCAICGKPLSPTSGEIGSTCKAHEGKLRQNAETREAVPEGYIRMSVVCRAAVENGLTIGQIVNASGGDACTKPIMDPVFQVVYVGRAKYMHPDVMTKGFNLLKAKVIEKPEKGSKVKVAEVSEVTSKAEANVAALKQAVKK